MLCSFQSTKVHRQRLLLKSHPIAQSTNGGDEEDRTPDPLRARQVLSQLSYTPMSFSTYFIIHSASNFVNTFFKSFFKEPSKLNSRLILPRKEVIQPHLPIRLPCYDFTPVIGFTFDGRFQKVS